MNEPYLGWNADNIEQRPSASPSDTRATTYGYALDGHWVSKAGVVNLTYLYDGENVICEIWDNNVKFPHRFRAVSVVAEANPSSWTILSASPSTGWNITTCTMGWERDRVDWREQNVVNYYRYTPRGRASQRTGVQPHQFTGRQYDAESGLYHYRARLTRPTSGGSCRTRLWRSEHVCVCWK